VFSFRSSESQQRLALTTNEDLIFGHLEVIPFILVQRFARLSGESRLCGASFTIFARSGAREKGRCTNEPSTKRSHIVRKWNLASMYAQDFFPVRRTIWPIDTTRR